MAGPALPESIALSLGTPIWERFFTVAPLVLVGTKEASGGHDLAPKHMAMPLGWQNFYCFVCSPRHTTYANARRTGEFTVSFPTSEQVVAAGLAAAPRLGDGSKPSLAALQTVPAAVVDGVLVAGSYLALECRLERTIDGFGENSIIAGEIVAASVIGEFARGPEVDDHELIAHHPVLAYLNPGRFAELGESRSFPFPQDFRL
jgi:flavin reductase (DIM6/NTAB) family NADH-FMN oxidoreductase RutF